MAKVPPLEIDVKLVNVDWLESSFRRWEQRAADRGSGLTDDQMTGVSVFVGWMRGELKRVYEEGGGS